VRKRDDLQYCYGKKARHPEKTSKGTPKARRKHLCFVGEKGLSLPGGGGEKPTAWSQKRGGARVGTLRRKRSNLRRGRSIVFARKKPPLVKKKWLPTRQANYRSQKKAEASSTRLKRKTLFRINPGKGGHCPREQAVENRSRKRVSSPGGEGPVRLGGRKNCRS